MKPDFPFHRLVPTFFAGLLDDPLLLLRTRPDGRHLLFDCGQLQHLAKRIFTRLDAVFISHAHMDHWMGMDTVIRQLIAADRTLDIYGGPGLADKFEHKLRAYDWNLAEDYWSSFRVHEIGGDGVSCDLFSGAESFLRRSLPAGQDSGWKIYENDYLEVLARSCDHRMPSLVFRVNERPPYRIDPRRIEELGLLPGAWLGELKHCFLRRLDYPERLVVPGRDGHNVVVSDVAALSAKLLEPRPGHAIGYVSDIGFTPDNRNTLNELLHGVDLLVCECTFLAEAEARARASSHLCTADLNRLMNELRPGYVLPMHLSRSYSRRSEELYHELVPPSGTEILRLPLQLTPRPLLADEVEWCLATNSQESRSVTGR